MPLHQLSNGNWIDPKRITAIVALERTQCWDGGPIHPARIVVHAGQQVEVCVCDDEEQARKMRDEFAVLVNGHNAKLIDDAT